MSAHGDAELPIIVAPHRQVGGEWRFVVADGLVMAGSRYDAATRTALPDDAGGAAWQRASAIAAKLRAPERV